MSQASTRSAAGRTRLFGVHGDSGTYKSAGLTDITVSVIAHEAEADYADLQPGERVKRHRRLIELLVSQVAAPRRGDIAVVDGEDWVLEHVVETRNGIHAGMFFRELTIPHQGRRLGPR